MALVYVTAKSTQQRNDSMRGLWTEKPDTKKEKHSKSRQLLLALLVSPRFCTRHCLRFRGMFFFYF